MADVKISELATASSVAASNVFPVTQGSATVKVTLEQVRDYVLVTGVNNQTGTTYTLALSDANMSVRCNNATEITVTVPANSSVAFPIGASVVLRQVGAGAVTVAGAGGVTINTPTGYVAKTGRQHASLMLHKVATNEWDLTGDVATS